MGAIMGSADGLYGVAARHLVGGHVLLLQLALLTAACSSGWACAALLYSVLVKHNISVL
jgi:hypothetical protein